MSDPREAPTPDNPDDFVTTSLEPSPEDAPEDGNDTPNGGF